MLLFESSPSWFGSVICSYTGRFECQQFQTRLLLPLFQFLHQYFTFIPTNYFNFWFSFSSLVSVHIMVFNYTSFYYFWCRNKNRSRNSLVWNCCYSDLPQVGLEGWSALTREDSNVNNFKQDCFFLLFNFCTNTLLLFIQNISIFDFIFSSLVSVHIMVFNYTSFYYFWCRSINRSRNGLVWNCCYSNFPQKGLEELSALTREDSNVNNFKQDCFYLQFSFCTNTLSYSYKIFQFFYFIFSSLVSVHIMVFNYTSFYYFCCRNINKSRNSLIWNCCYSNLPQVGLEELSALTREDSNVNNFKQDCFYL